jgi:DNA helicase IV
MKLPTYQDLSKEQDKINNLALEASHVVVGPPGTGKTVMALYRAQMLAEEEVKAVLLMYSKLLSQYTSSAVEELEIDGMVKTFHQWFGGFWKGNYRTNPPQVEPYRFDWPEVMQTLLHRPPRASTLPHLIIDEAQDLSRQFFMLAKHVAKHVTVFCDENQRLAEDNSTIDDVQRSLGIEKVHLLTKNYRNTKEIAALAAHFYTGLSSGIPKPPTRSGDIPAVLKFPRLYETVDYIVRYERTNDDKQIGVLTPNNKVREKFVNRLSGKTVNDVQTYYSGCPDAVDFDQPGIYVVNFQSAKGLEFDTVFLPELQAMGYDLERPEFRMLFYVLLSRAREQLYLAYSGEECPACMSAFPKELLEWR